MPKEGMSGWLIALIVILVIFILVMIILAIVSSSSSGQSSQQQGNSNGNQNIKNKDIVIHEEKKHDESSSSSPSSKYCRNIDILYASISLSTGEFIQNAKNGSKRVGNSFKNMNKHAVSIGETIHQIYGAHGDEYSEYLLQKNSIYKNIVEYVIVKQKTLNVNDHLLHGLNSVNEKLASLLVKMNDTITYEQYVDILHKYDVLVVKQIHYTNEGDSDNADKANQEAQTTLILISSNSCR